MRVNAKILLPMTIQASIDAYLNHCQVEKNLNPKTLKAYGADMNQFQAFTAEKAIQFIGDVDRIILREYFHRLSHLKPRTVRRKMTCLKTMFNYMEFDDIIETNPFRKMQLKYKMPKYLPSVMNVQEVEQILRAVYNHRKTIVDKSLWSYAEATRDICILETLFATGIRVSELCQLKKSQVDLTTGSILILGKGRKERIVQVVSKETRSLLQEYCALFSAAIEKEQFFFINRLSRRISSQSIRYMVAKYVRMARIEKKITPHTFRHTFATLLLEADVDIKYIQHFLGHSSIMTTQIYTHVNKQKQVEILEAKHPRLGLRMVILDEG